MTALITAAEIVLLIALVILPLIGPRKTKTPPLQGHSDFGINEYGALEPIRTNKHYSA